MSQTNNAAEAGKQSDKQKKHPWWLLLLLLLLISLTLLTSLMVVIRIGDFLPEDVNVIFLVPKKPEFHIGDGEDHWNTKSELNLFEMIYTDRDGNVTARSDNREDIIAPGTENEYTFSLNNTGNIAVDYDANVGISISAGEFGTLPVKMKMQRYDGTYVFGSDTDWVSIEDIRDVKETGTLGAGRYTAYTLTWKWDFESGDDAYDTLLGNASVLSDLSMVLSLDTHAEASADSASGGGEQIIDEKTGKPYEAYGGQIGGDFRMPYFPLLVLLLIILLTVFIVLVVKRKKKEDPRTADSD